MSGCITYPLSFDNCNYPDRVLNQLYCTQHFPVLQYNFKQTTEIKY